MFVPSAQGHLPLRLPPLCDHTNIFPGFQEHQPHCSPATKAGSHPQNVLIPSFPPVQEHSQKSSLVQQEGSSSKGILWVCPKLLTTNLDKTIPASFSWLLHSVLSLLVSSFEMSRFPPAHAFSPDLYSLSYSCWHFVLCPDSSVRDCHHLICQLSPSSSLSIRQPSLSGNPSLPQDSSQPFKLVKWFSWTIIFFSPQWSSVRIDQHQSLAALLCNPGWIEWKNLSCHLLWILSLCRNREAANSHTQIKF